MVYIIVCHHMKDIKIRRCNLYLNMLLSVLCSSDTCINWYIARFNFREIVVSFHIQLKIIRLPSMGAIFWNYIFKHILNCIHLSEIFLQGVLFVLCFIKLKCCL